MYGTNVCPPVFGMGGGWGMHLWGRWGGWGGWGATCGPVPFRFPHSSSPLPIRSSPAQ